MNKLQYETSPYLLQHKDNPVDWYPWGKEAIQKAVTEDKPILLSIGYSACHWCHVMEKESFENREIAKEMNENFVSIKVDREERPDIDNIYMNFVQMTTGSGGWPLTVVLTPELIPFYGGTYFPPEDRYGRMGFLKLLKNISNIYKTRKNEIVTQKKDVLGALNEISSLPKIKAEFSQKNFDNAFEKILEEYDKEYGGFGDAPKFPGSMTYMFLLRYYAKNKNSGVLDMVKNSLLRMASGGIYDQLGGGFHRYSTDVKWLIPHFEKMLYDNALLSRLYLETYQATGDQFFLGIAEDIFNYIMREMTGPAGGFYSSQNADSEGKEGKYFIWKFEELPAVLNNEEINLAVRYFKITSFGNFESFNILTSPIDREELCRELNIDEYSLTEEISRIKLKMLSAREKRVKPSLDDKILTNWNGLMIYSFALGYGITGKKEYLEAAENCAHFIWEHCFDGEVLFHSYKNGQLKYNGYLDNYSFIIEAFISLYEVTFNEEWINKAKTLAEIMISKFYDAKNKDFYYSPAENSDLIIRVKDIYDNAIPSGNSSAVFSLLKLAVYVNKSDYRKIAEDDISHLHAYMTQHPLSFSYILSAGYFDFVKPKEIAVIVKNANLMRSIIKDIFNNFLPFIIPAGKLDEMETNLVLLKDKKVLNDVSTFYICQDYTCKVPIYDLEEALTELKNI